MIDTLGLGEKAASSDKAVPEKTGELSGKTKPQPWGGPILALFNPPWTLPFLRWNEVMVEVKRA